MVWRKWNVIVILILANYLVFATLAVLAFPESNEAVRTRAANATFTPRPTELKRVSPIPYDFGSPTMVAGTPTRGATPTITISATPVATATPITTATPIATATPSGPTATLIRPTPTETIAFATPAPAVGSSDVTPTPTR